MGPFALAHDDQPQGALVAGVTHGQCQHPGATIDTTMGVPQQFGFSPGAFAACDLPGFALLARGIQQLVAFLPAHDEAQVVPPQLPEPGTVAIAPIEDMAHHSAPVSCHLAKPRLLLLPLLPTDTLLPTPPAHGHHLGNSTVADQQEAFPLKAGHADLHPWPIEDPFAATCQSPDPAGAHAA